MVLVYYSLIDYCFIHLLGAIVVRKADSIVEFSEYKTKIFSGFVSNDDELELKAAYLGRYGLFFSLKSIDSCKRFSFDLSILYSRSGF